MSYYPGVTEAIVLLVAVTLMLPFIDEVRALPARWFRRSH